MQPQKTFLVSVFIYVLFVASVSSEGGNFYLKAAKNVPRIGRSNNKNSNIDEMGKFLMKASKSVPRIGRRNENLDYGQAIDKRYQIPLWADIAERFEYDPELMMSPDYLEKLEMGDDPSIYDFEQVRPKRDAYKKHHKVHYMMV